MTTYTSVRARSTFPVGGAGQANVLHVAWGFYDVTVEPAPSDIIELCRLPKGATVIGGFVQASDIDTDASETLDFDVGWAANGVDNADDDGFGNFGVQTGDASVHLPVAGLWMPFANIIQNPGYKTFSAETKIVANIIDDPATFTAGAIKVVVFYVMNSPTVG
jgi:hypothetical protein